jgi:hypothetical protein
MARGALVSSRSSMVGKSDRIDAVLDSMAKEETTWR